MSSGAFDQGQKYRDEPVIVLAKPGSPMLAPSLEPKRLRREELLAAAQEARRQLCRGPRSKVDMAQVARWMSFLQVNGLAFDVRWELDQPITEGTGQPSASK